MLEAMFSGRHDPLPTLNGKIFINRDWKIFQHVIFYLRSNLQYKPVSMSNDIKNLYELELKYWGLTQAEIGPIKVYNL